MFQLARELILTSRVLTGWDPVTGNTKIDHTGAAATQGRVDAGRNHVTPLH